MQAAIVTASGAVPVYGEFTEPKPAEDEVLITVAAASMSHVVKSRASGTHYSSGGVFPFVAGIDGVGRLDNGQRVYFVAPRTPFGSMAERVAVKRSNCIPLPDSIDDLTAAAIANPGMSAWAAYTERARLQSGQTVLVHGATGTAGRLAVQIAKHLGASKVIAVARNRDGLQEVAALGADVVIQLTADADAMEEVFQEQFALGVDVVVDYLWGKSAETLLIAAAKAAPEAVPLRFVQIGSLGGAEINLPSAVLRASAIELMGSGIGSIPFQRLLYSTEQLLQAAALQAFKIAYRSAPLSSVATAWHADNSQCRSVFTLP